MKKIPYTNPIIPRLRGRTGNMMFQIAHAYAQSLKYSRQLVVPLNDSPLTGKDKTLFRGVNFGIPSTHQVDFEFDTVHAPFHFEQVYPNESRATIFEGWFQSNKYFLGYEKEIKNLYSPPVSFIDEVYTTYPFFKDKIVAAINIRRGDYLDSSQSINHPVVSLDYIYKAYSNLPKHDVLLIMSDGIEWCKENINLPNTVFNDNTKFWDERGIWLLSLCDYFIISNSTYSWWGAWLSKGANKVVIAPDTWFGPGLQHLDTTDLYCSDWIKIPTVYKDGFLEIL